jgi:hypothetical protein
MKKLIALLLCFSVTAWAAPNDAAIANMNGWCTCVMDGGICRVDNDVRPVRPGSQVFTSGGPIPAEVYNDIRALGAGMCADLVQTCKSDWDGQRCQLGYRRMFRQEASTCFPAPGAKLVKP